MEKTLIDKFIEGDLTEAEFETERAKLTPEQQEELQKEASKKKPDAIKELIGLRRDKDKIISKKEGEGEDFGKKFREEQFDKAKANFFTKFGIEKDEDKKSFEEGFKKFDSGKVDVDNIMKDMKAYYVSTDPDKFLGLAEEEKKRKEEADDFNASQAGSSGGGSGGGGAPKISKEVKAYMDASAKQGMPITAEQAEKNLKMAKAGNKIPTV